MLLPDPPKYTKLPDMGCIDQGQGRDGTLNFSVFNSGCLEALEILKSWEEFKGKTKMKKDM